MEQRVWTYLVEANPIPDVDSSRSHELDVAAHLESLEERSSHMQLDTTTRRSGAKERGMSAALAGAAAAVVIGAVWVVIALAGSTDDVLSAGDFVGVWESNDGVYLQFNNDGTFSAAWTLDEVSAGTFETGTWSYDGTEFAAVTGESEGNCAPGDEGRYAVELVEGDVVRLNPIWDPCLDRLHDLMRGPLHRVSF